MVTQWNVEERLRGGRALASAIGFSLAVVVSSGAVAGAAPGLASNSADDIYTAEQATRGEQIYKRECAICHREDLRGRRSDGGPALRGNSFTSRWGGLSIQAMLDITEELMPMSHPGNLSRQQYVDVVSHILRVNGLPSGTRELPTSPEQLRHVVVTFSP